VAEGAGVIQTTVAGIGERAGNAPMEETLLALLTMYGIDTGVRTERFYELSRLVLDLAGVSQPSNRPVTGERLFHVESGIIATWIKNCGPGLITEAFPYRPELVGQGPLQIVLGKGSGTDSVAIWLDRLGLAWENLEQLKAILAEVKAASLVKKGLLDEEEFRTIVTRVLPESTGGSGPRKVP
jgi:isopropylmalate/homocitrate/citramalate synthase